MNFFRFSKIFIGTKNEGQTLGKNQLDIFYGLYRRYNIGNLGHFDTAKIEASNKRIGQKRYFWGQVGSQWGRNIENWGNFEDNDF